ncbi:hypothetical protein RDI58_000205 [Solanum bulbocastanum]|uniref:Uncharacterized protein n=1 Tax=Solanum bulbocastanum TaxID=147425 RepID=A0AAN8YNW4_SOLBU
MGNIYDLAGQVLAANCAPTIFHLAREIRAEVEEMGNHKVAIIDSTGKHNDMEAPVSNSGRINMNSLKEKWFGKEQTIDYYTTVLKITGFDHIPMGGYYFGEFMDD